MKKIITVVCMWVVIIALTTNCAKRGTPTGGAKDTIPPVLLDANPKQGTTNFKNKSIRLTFDEFVKLKDIQKQLIVSPPLTLFPDIVPQGVPSKYFDIKISDTLKENTTYVFNFGQSVTDNNEGNPLPFFKYVFSTGSYIDSLSVRGRISDALEQKPDNFVTVMLYELNESYSDSVVFKERPLYVTNTLDSLRDFEISNVKAGKYLLRALKDKNSNYLYDQKSDKIAFWEEPISVPSDSVYELKLFKEINNYKAIRPSQVASNRIQFGYEGTLAGIEINPISPLPPDFKYAITKEPKKDTLNFWYSPVDVDSLLFTVGKEQKIDTFTVKLKKLKKDSLQIANTQSSSLSLKIPFSLSSNIPLVATDISKMKIFEKDTLSVPIDVTIKDDNRKLQFNFKVEPSQVYRLQMLPEALTDFYGVSSDTLQYTLRTKSLSDYGTIKLKLSNAKVFPIIVQITNEKGEVQDEIYAESFQSEFLFEYLDPAKYFIRIIEDVNNNRVWDTGNYLEKLQPERVLYYPTVVTVRANWVYEETFTLQ